MWQQKANFAIAWMCRRLGVSRASYYQWAQPAVLTPTAEKHAELSVAVQDEFEKSGQMAGRDQLTKILNTQWTDGASGTVGSIMNEYGLRSRRSQAWKKTTVNDPEARTEHIQNDMLDKHRKLDFTSSVPGGQAGRRHYVPAERFRVAVSDHGDRFGHPYVHGLVDDFEHAHAVDY